MRPVTAVFGVPEPVWESRLVGAPPISGQCVYDSEPMAGGIFVRLVVAGLFLVVLELTFTSTATAQVSVDTWPLPTRLREHIERTTGAGATDCGQLGALPAPPGDTTRYVDRQITCGADAVRAKKAFWAIQWLPGTDSSICTGLLADREGTTYRFVYDSSPCGGLGCPDRFSLERCPVPVEVAQRLACLPR